MEGETTHIKITYRKDTWLKWSSETYVGLLAGETIDFMLDKEVTFIQDLNI